MNKKKIRKTIQYMKYIILGKVSSIIHLPKLIIAIIRFRISFARHCNDSDAGIGLVVDGLGEGGLERIVMNLYKCYRKLGEKSYIIIVSDSVSDYIGTLEDDPRQFRILYYNKAKLLDYCRENKIYTLHYHFSTFAMKTAKLAKIKTVYTIHNTYVWYTPRMWRRLRASLKKCDAIIAVSQFVKDFFEIKTQFNNIKVIENGIDTKKILELSQEKKNSKEQRVEYGFSAKDKVVAMVASFTEQKYHLALIVAAEELVKRGRSDIKILFCGPKTDKKLFKRIRDIVNKSIAKDIISFKEGISPKRIGSFLRHIPNIVVLPSLYEGGVPPLIVIESIVCGTPVIMTDLGISKTTFGKKFIQTIPPAVEDLSILTPSNIRQIVLSKNVPNASILADKIIDLIDNESMYRKQIANVPVYGLDQERMAKEYIKVFNSIH